MESLAVFDSALGAWRRAHPELCLARAEELQDLLCASSFLDLTSRYSVELSQPEGRISRTEAWTDHIHEIISPWFHNTMDAARLAEVASEHLVRTVAPDLVEFAISRGEREQARLILERAVEIRPMYRDAFEDGREMARSGVRPDWPSAPCLGWSSVVHDLW
ncbi:hypothetical protein BZB76_1378 [Actinomadura pelletieri DSM 43383]|uniref:Uncharacterized protein n=1 Tax=Actinomadura pelletieri DSM 43383 TaxID=1120940 RepID=A0A495R076_9ACTN|nr:hypothetical protein BZB76_1378 [Actinomadura pelletieri DSM 43383]